MLHRSDPSSTAGHVDRLPRRPRPPDEGLHFAVLCERIDDTLQDVRPLAPCVVRGDVTDTKRIYERLRDADRCEDEFLATLAHALRNPLAPIRSGLEMLRIWQSDTAEPMLPMMSRPVDHRVRLIEVLARAADGADRRQHDGALRDQWPVKPCPGRRRSTTACRS